MSDKPPTDPHADELLPARLRRLADELDAVGWRMKDASEPGEHMFARGAELLGAADAIRPWARQIESDDEEEETEDEYMERFYAADVKYHSKGKHKDPVVAEHSEKMRKRYAERVEKARREKAERNEK